MKRAYKYRLYPTAEQCAWLARNFGCVRKVYNEALGWRIAAYNADGTSISCNDTVKALPQLKQFYPWLAEADSCALQQSLRHLQSAYDGFFAGRSKFPKFKKRGSRQSYTTMYINNNICVGDKSVALPKLGQVRAVIHRPLPDGAVITSATVSMERDGTYYVSVLCEMPDRAVIPVRPDPDKVLGLDYKSNGLYAGSDGSRADMPQWYRQSEKKLVRQQRSLARKQKGSHNREKARLALAKTSRHAANQRKDFLNKQTAMLADAWDLVGIEDLDMKAMSCKRGKYRLGKSVMDNGWGEFTRMLEYKLEARGKYLIKVSQWYASSQTCHHCGYVNPITKDLKIRRITCPVCGATYDRDDNASLNIRDEAWRIYCSA